MTLTPREIQEKQFHDAFRGYSHEEVDLFIDQVAEAYDQIYRENQTLRRRIEELEQQADGRPPPEFIPPPVTVQAATTPAPPAESDEMLKRVLMTAQESADKAVQNARVRAQALIEEAEAKARRIEEQTEAMRSNTLEDAQRRASETLAMAAREEADLKERIEGLRIFERDYRTRLSAFVRSQLELLETKPMITSGASLPSASSWDRSKSFSLPKPAPKPAPESSSWLSLSYKPSTVEAAPKPSEPVSEPASPEASEQVKPKSENRSIRELFWGDD